MVSGVVAISTGRTFSAVWATNTLWVLGYDIVASSFSLFTSWLYLFFDNPAGLSRFGFLAVFAPIIVIKHAYTKLKTLQSLYDELDSAHAKLEQNVREQLAMMVKSIEARDPYTSGHSMRVAAVSKAIAIDFGLSEDLIEEVENAALLHDVGKIHAEFAPLLQKEGKLTPEEWEIMKTHSVKSAELVGLFTRFEGHVQDSVRHHHERWDGLGYAAGIAAEAIPLGARIIMIADTIDAMTTDRPYRKALGFDAVVSELIKHRGTQFDPRLVDCAVNSVTIRRMIAEPNLGVSSVDVGLQIVQSAPLRSYDSFFLGRRRS
jgi:HD-GYP domain-containing protein (c-di-GMP phosphodiesterase class II)